MRFTSFTSLALFLSLGACSSTASPDGGTDAADHIGPVDVVGDAARTCTSAAECATGEICVFATAGCGNTGVCMQDFACGRVSLPYCNCSHVTFFDHCAGPAEPWVSMGECEGPIPDAGGSDSGAIDGGVVDAGTPADSGGGACAVDQSCGIGLTCCNGGCMNLNNDPLNCGACGHACGAAASMCAGGTCVAPMCGTVCEPGETCCFVDGPGPSRPPMCYPGVTCPVGCPACQ